MYQIVLCTCPSTEVAHNIAESIVKQQLAACVNIVSNVTSVYQWQGKLQKGKEIQLLIKSKASLFDTLTNVITQLHPYDVPEIIAIDIKAGNSAYLHWLKDSLNTHD